MSTVAEGVREQIWRVTVDAWQLLQDIHGHETDWRNRRLVRLVIRACRTCLAERVVAHSFAEFVTRTIDRVFDRRFNTITR